MRRRGLLQLLGVHPVNPMSNGSVFTIVVRFRMYLGVRAGGIRKSSFAPEVDLGFVGHKVFTNSITLMVSWGHFSADRMRRDL